MIKALLANTGVDPLAVWGAALSTILALVQFWEIWRNRSRIEVGHNFTSHPEIGNEVIIRNLGQAPVLITYWELLWRHRGLFRWKQTREIHADEFFEDLKLNGHSTDKLVFNQQNSFDWSRSALGKDQIYLRLHIAGKARPIIRKVYE
jgi:hypothetical protein